MLKIENKAYDAHKTFEELSVGDVFIYDGEVFMKTDGETGDTNALHLVSGELNGFFLDDEVRVVNATLTVE